MKFTATLISLLILLIFAAASVHGAEEHDTNEEAVEAMDHDHEDDITIAVEGHETVFSTIESYFPGSITATELRTEINDIFVKLDIQTSSTLLAASVCPDEINTSLYGLQEMFGYAFKMGGLAGVPFTGYTGFAAFKSHVQDDGALIILYAPHVGISYSGSIGKTNRVGQSHESKSCGSAVGAYGAVEADGTIGLDPFDGDFHNDYQQHNVRAIIANDFEAINNHETPMQALPESLYKTIRSEILEIVTIDQHDVKIILLGGIQVNTPHDMEEYFQILDLELLDTTGDLLDLMGPLDTTDTGDV